METQPPDLAKAVYELDKRTSVFQARCEQQWSHDTEFRASAHADLKELKHLVTAIRINRAGDQAKIAMVVTGAGLLLMKLVEMFVG